MRSRWCFLLLCWTLVGFADEFPAWQKQAYAQSKHLPALHHVVGVKLRDSMTPPNTFLLKAGRVLQCATCHGLEDIENIPYDNIDKNAPQFLRLQDNQKIEALCMNCHDAKAHERLNIHVMVNQNGTIKEDTCLFCHREVNTQRETKRELMNANLRLPAEKVCVGCHLKTPHLNAIEHTDSVLSENSHSSAKNMVAQIKQLEAKGIARLPLSEDNKILCITCHSPHEAGVLDEHNLSAKQVQGDVKKGVEYSAHAWRDVVEADKRERLETIQLSLPPYQRLEKEVLLRLPAKDGTLCLSCHEFEK